MEVYRFARQLKVPKVVVLDIAQKLGVLIEDEYSDLDWDQQTFIAEEWQRIVDQTGCYPHEYVRSLMLAAARPFIHKKVPCPGCAPG
jgi:hypothetical protein